MSVIFLVLHLVFSTLSAVSRCVAFMALTDKGQEMVTHEHLKEALTQGYDVAFTFYPDKCLSTVSPADEPSIWSGHVSCE